MGRFRRWSAVQVCKYTNYTSRSSDKNVFEYFITYSVSYYSSLCSWLVHLASFWKWGFWSKTLTFKMRPSVQSFLWKWVWFAMKSHFHIKGWALNLVLIQRPRGTRKWPNVFSFVLAGTDWDIVFWWQIWLVPFLVAALKPKQTYCGWAKNEPVVYSWLAVLNKLYFEIFKNLSTFFWCSCSAY